VERVNHRIAAPQAYYEDRKRSEDVIFERLESSEEESEGDLGTQDKKIVYLFF
jgi:hypothetical protein